MKDFSPIRIKQGVFNEYIYLEDEPQDFEELCDTVRDFYDLDAFVIYFVDFKYKKIPINTNKKYRQLMEYKYNNDILNLTLFVYTKEDVIEQDYRYLIKKSAYKRISSKESILSIDCCSDLLKELNNINMCKCVKSC